jgi:hypothetical protein
MEYKLLLIRLWVITIASLVSIIVYQFIIKPYILEPMCLIDTQSCLKIQYQSFENSVLVHMIPTGYWVWFDGKDILIYGETGRVCKDEGFQSVYAYDVSTRKIIGYMCAKSLSEVKDFYKRQNSPKEYIFKKKFKDNFDVYDVINLLADQKIISINTS